jgi:hypothetical protein
MTTHANDISQCGYLGVWGVGRRIRGVDDNIFPLHPYTNSLKSATHSNPPNLDPIGLS